DAAPPACPYAFSNAVHCPMTQSDNERQRLVAVLEQLPAAVVIVDALTREVVLWNDGGKHLTGLNEHGQTLDGMLRDICAFRPNGEPWLEEEPMRLALAGTRVRSLE